MKCKKGVFLKYIPMALKDEALPGTRLREKALGYMPVEKRPKYPKKPFIEAVLCLMHKKIIQPDGYNMDLDNTRVRKQSFNPDGFIFSLVKTRPLEILVLLEELNSSITIENAKIKLHYLFKKKIAEIESENNKNWQDIKRKVIVKEPTDEELLWYHSFKIAVNYMNREHPRIIRIDDTGIFFGKIHANIEKFKENIPSIREKYKNVKLYILKDHLLPLHEEDFRPISLRDANIFSEEINVEDFLKKIDSGFTEPLVLTDEHLDSIFYRDLLLYISTLPENEKNRFKMKISEALSNEPNSDVTLHELISEITGDQVKLIKTY